MVKKVIPVRWRWKNQPIYDGNEKFKYNVAVHQEIVTYEMSICQSVMVKVTYRRRESESLLY